MGTGVKTGFHRTISVSSFGVALSCVLLLDQAEVGWS